MDLKPCRDVLRCEFGEPNVPEARIKVVANDLLVARVGARAELSLLEHEPAPQVWTHSLLFSQVRKPLVRTSERLAEFVLHLPSSADFTCT